MSHFHFCDVVGHEWECNGTASRPLAGGTEPSICMCQPCGVPMEEGDHGNCPIELLACPEHAVEQRQRMNEDGLDDGHGECQPEATMFRDADGMRTVGICLWCGMGFRSMEEVEVHNADLMAACPVFQELKSVDCMPPYLQLALEDVGLPADPAENDSEKD